MPIPTRYSFLTAMASIFVASQNSPSLKFRVGRLPVSAPASMTAPVPLTLSPGGFSLTCFAIRCASALTASGSASSGGLCPLTATPFSLLEPMMAPVPLLPATWLRSLTTQARRERFSPEGPMRAVLARSSPTSSLILSSQSATWRPQSFEASLSSASPSLTQSQTGSSAAPSKTIWSKPACLSSAGQ